MTPNEKKARENLTLCDPEVAEAIVAAERRGFERAKELMLEELKTRDFIGPLTVRNLKYEEDA